MKQVSSLLICSAVIILTSACDKLPNGFSNPVEQPSVATPESKDIVETALGAENFKTLVSLLTESGLVNTLKGEGPFTVFAPSDEAFAKIPATDLQALKSDPEKLKKVLLYHVLPTKVLAADAPANADVPTAATSSVKIVKENGSVKVNNATVTSADILAKNGVIHVIDTVLMPPM